MEQEKIKNDYQINSNIELNPKVKTLKPYRCPVCGGRGIVPFDFYNFYNTVGISRRLDDFFFSTK